MLIVSEETSLGMPALICAWREGICPWPACSTWPMTTWSTCSGSTPARSSAASIASPPSSVASSADRPPPILPIGVRAAAEDHGLGHRNGSLLSRWLGKACWDSGASGEDRPAIAERADGVVRTPEIVPADIARMQVSAHHRSRPRAPTPTRSRSACSRARSRRRRARASSARCSPPARPARVAQVARAAHAEGKRWLLVGLGEREELHARARARGRRVVARARARARPRGRSAGRRRRRVSPSVAAALVEGTILADYRFERHKSAPADEERDDAAQAPGGPDHLGAGASSRADGRARRRCVAEAVNGARDLQNRPGNDLTPTALAEHARRWRRRSTRCRSRSRAARRSSRAGWARSPRSRRAPTRSRR